MTYETRQEVLRAAADWMDVCSAASGVEAKCKHDGIIKLIGDLAFPEYNEPSSYEFPLALLEGKEVWVGSELYNRNGIKFTASKITKCGTGAIVNRDESIGDIPSYCSWNPPKPKTVMVEMLVEDANEVLRIYSECFVTTDKIKSAAKSISTALEKL